MPTPIDEMTAILAKHLIKADEYTDCAIVYRVTFDQLRNLYDAALERPEHPVGSALTDDVIDQIIVRELGLEANDYQMANFTRAIEAEVLAATPSRAPAAVSEPCLAIACPHCWVEAGKPCIWPETRTRNRDQPHDDRKAAFAAQPAVAPSDSAKPADSLADRFEQYKHDERGRTMAEVVYWRQQYKQLCADLLAAAPTPDSQGDDDGEAFRTAAKLGLTLRFYGGCAQSSIPGSPSAYEVVSGSDRAASMREAVRRAAQVIARGGEAQRLNQGANPTPDSKGAAEPTQGELAVRYLKGFADGRRVEKEARTASAASEPVAYVPRCHTDGERYIAGEFSWEEVSEKPFDVNPDWECAPLFLHPSSGAQAAGQEDAEAMRMCWDDQALEEKEHYRRVVREAQSPASRGANNG